MADALERESSHHTSAYQYKVIEKCVQLLIHEHVILEDISEARLAYAFYCEGLAGIPCELRALSRSGAPNPLPCFALGAAGW